MNWFLEYVLKKNNPYNYYLCMTKFKCDKCDYETNDKRNFDKHNNRKIPCFFNNAKLHGNVIKNTNKNDEIICKYCSQSFSRHDSLIRHIKSQHATINENHNNATINGNHNSPIINNTIHNTTNIINTIINPTIIVHPFTTYNIFDLTMFEQYKTLTSEISPYTSILDHYNLNPNRPQYHNMHLGNIKTNIMDVYNETGWEKESIASTMKLLVPTHQDLIGALLNRFRIFLNVNAIKLIPLAIYYGCAENLKYYRQIVLNVKLHLYKNRLNNQCPDLNIPKDRNDEIFWAISKNFIWSEVEHLMTKLDKYNIDLNQNLDSIKNQILESKMKITTKNNLYKKLIKRIESLIVQFQSNLNEEDKSVSSSDTLSCCDSCTDSYNDSSSDSKNDSGSDSKSDCKSNSRSYSERKFINESKKNCKKSKKNSIDKSDSESDFINESKKNCKKSKKNFIDKSDSESHVYSKKINKKKFKKKCLNKCDSESDAYPIKINKSQKISNNESKKELNASPKKSATSSDSESDICSKDIRNKLKKYLSDDNFSISPKKNHKKSLINKN